jgi:hypothetical protein
MSILRLFDVSILIGLALGSSTVHAAPPPPAATSEDPLSEHRERFKVGMDRYNAGAISEAIGYWEPIYRQLGAHTGYRLAYNLGVAYGHLGDATRAAERLQAFLDEVDARRGQGQALGAVVAKEESDAHDRLADLMATRGRIRIQAADPPVTVQVDASEPRLAGFVAWVQPGEHTVTFEPQGSASETKIVQANAGDLVDVTPPSPPPTPAATSVPLPSPAPSSSGPRPTAQSPSIALPRADFASETTPPFSPAVLVAGAGLEVALAVAAIALESRAISLRDQIVSGQSVSGSISPGDRQRFDAARTWAYTAVGGVAGVGAITTGLVTWYLLGSSKHAALVEPAFLPERGGVTASALAHF